ncbi:hypothetical protein GCM10027184_11190 [Saccharothrix stipae]
MPPSADSTRAFNPTVTAWLVAPAAAHSTPTATTDGSTPTPASSAPPTAAPATAHRRAPNRSIDHPVSRAVQIATRPKPVSTDPRCPAPSPNESPSRSATRNDNPPRQPQATNPAAANHGVRPRHAPRRRGRSPPRGGSAGKPTTANAPATTAAPTNAHRHDASAANPLSNGAIVWPAACMDANTPNARPNRAFGVTAAIAASSRGVVNAFAAPCTARPPSSTGNDHDTAHNTDATTYTA